MNIAKLSEAHRFNFDLKEVPTYLLAISRCSACAVSTGEMLSTPSYQDYKMVDDDDKDCE